MRTRFVLACLASLVIAACGDDGGSSTTDGGNNGSDSGGPDAPPMPNCNALDLSAATAVQITNAMVTANGQGGALTAGTYKLSSVKLFIQGVTVTGTAKARVEFVTGSATTGAARVALNIDGMAFGMPIQQDVSGAGLYTLSGSSLNLTEGCGGTNPLDALTYTATSSGVTIWTTYMVTSPLPITVPIELLFVPE